jgi:magnesium chelatase subunit I
MSVNEPPVAPAEAAVLPYSRIVGQKDVKRALELSYIAPGIGGVLISGERGTAKSTAVRAFSLMMYGELPVTLPINATDDRIIGGWRLDELMRGTPVKQPGLLEEAGRRGMLYIDEVNLLDDHLVNIILDVASTGVLTIQREAIDEKKEIRFSLIGTMNPEEGWLRPQLLDRFGLMVQVSGVSDPGDRQLILSYVLEMDEARFSSGSDFLVKAREEDVEHRRELEAARDRLYEVTVNSGVAHLCAEVAQQFQVQGHRGDVVLALAARALAALEGAAGVGPSHVIAVAPMALRHRRTADLGAGNDWTDQDDGRLQELVLAWQKTLRNTGTR